MLSNRIDFDSIPWQSALPGARFKAYQEGAKQIRLLESSSDFVEPVWCEKGHVGFVLEGTLEVDFNSGWWSIRKDQASSLLGALQLHIRRGPLRQLYSWYLLKMFTQ